MSKPPRLTLPPTARAYLLDTGRGGFAVHEAGEPVRGTALLLPGFTGSKEDFVALLEPLAAAGYRVLAVDGRGQYQSPGPREEDAYALEELARDVLAQVRALDAGPVHLVGHSLGGLIARAAVLRDPAPFASLTLLSSGPAAIAEEQQARTKLLVAALEALREDMPGVWAAMRAHDPQDASPDSGELTAFLRERWLETVPEQLIATGRALICEPDRVAELAAVALPKLVLSGTVDYAWPVPLMDDMARRLGAARVVVEGAEHSPNAENPQVTAGALASFWDSCCRA
ncbi:alpha/beta fold hydrolase [Streptomyces subrutilus]|uniref:Alpha/beta hydrolase n=1 Tax=Streptomyces subrutilus TaxID=36818 RepID=A0A5P2UKQ8_9ACTN|nr:alpha/beta hydrolase [Streptomyces subrutilus]QEU78925.1 alpha/beta hydrolase [Streptomyces subrutilus]WSJ31893.1 alpha/beta hydrolase [Streptomyces subrutilus]GGZ84058.1 alpha/beta hydrolase [Streptomyces subrutilus]